MLKEQLARQLKTILDKYEVPHSVGEEIAGVIENSFVEFNSKHQVTRTMLDNLSERLIVDEYWFRALKSQMLTICGGIGEKGCFVQKVHEPKIVASAEDADLITSEVTVLVYLPTDLSIPS